MCLSHLNREKMRKISWNAWRGSTMTFWKTHEHAAETARWIVLLTAISGVAGLTYFKNEKKTGFTVFLWISFLLALVAAGYLIYTGYLGGFIRHDELAMLLLSK